MATFLRGWPYWCIGSAIILNFFQLLVSPHEILTDRKSIIAALESGKRTFSHTSFGSCQLQLDYLASNVNNKSIIVGGVNPVFWVEIILLMTTFSIVFLIYFRSKNIIKLDTTIFSFRWSIATGAILLMIDQIRYINTSVTIIKKNFYTWSSYCFHGDLGWLFDVLAYVPVYFSLGAIITIFVRVVMRVSPDNANIKFNNIGMKLEHKFISGTMTWVSLISITFFVFWLTGTNIGITASIFYAAQAVVIFLLILCLLMYSGYRSYTINSWYQNQFEITREKIAVTRKIDVQEVLDSDVLESGIAENPFDEFMGVEGKNFGKLFAAIAGPIVGYLASTVPGIQKVLAAYKALI